jgi:hypothetical protein
MFIAASCRARACFTSSSISSIFGLNDVCLLPILRCTSVSYLLCKFCNGRSDSAAQCMPETKTLHKACPCVRGRCDGAAPLSSHVGDEAHPWQLRHDLQRAVDGEGQITAKRERSLPSPRLTPYGTKKTCQWHRRCGTEQIGSVLPQRRSSGRSRCRWTSRLPRALGATANGSISTPVAPPGAEVGGSLASAQPQRIRK